jgi:hypothetical protein
VAQAPFRPAAARRAAPMPPTPGTLRPVQVAAAGYKGGQRDRETERERERESQRERERASPASQGHASGSLSVTLSLSLGHSLSATIRLSKRTRTAGRLVLWATESAGEGVGTVPVTGPTWRRIDAPDDWPRRLRLQSRGGERTANKNGGLEEEEVPVSEHGRNAPWKEGQEHCHCSKL